MMEEAWFHSFENSCTGALHYILAWPTHLDLIPNSLSRWRWVSVLCLARANTHQQEEERASTPRASEHGSLISIQWKCLNPTIGIRSIDGTQGWLPNCKLSTSIASRPGDTMASFTSPSYSCSSRSTSKLCYVPMIASASPTRLSTGCYIFRTSLLPTYK
jgi:hypothetical protein